MSVDIRALKPLYGTVSACQICGHEIQYVQGLPHGFLTHDGWAHTDTSILYSDHLIAPTIENNAYIRPEPTDTDYPDAHTKHISEIARAEAGRVIEARAISMHVYYFAPPPDALITYAFHRQEIAFLSSEINALHQRISVLERPWWRRWFNR